MILKFIICFSENFTTLPNITLESKRYDDCLQSKMHHIMLPAYNGVKEKYSETIQSDFIKRIILYNSWKIIFITRDEEIFLYTIKQLIKNIYHQFFTDFPILVSNLVEAALFWLTPIQLKDILSYIDDFHVDKLTAQLKEMCKLHSLTPQENAILICGFFKTIYPKKPCSQDIENLVSKIGGFDQPLYLKK